MDLLRTIRLALADAQRAERLVSEGAFRGGLRRYPRAALASFALAHRAPVRDSELRRVERIVRLRQIA